MRWVFKCKRYYSPGKWPSVAIKVALRLLKPMWCRNYITCRCIENARRPDRNTHDPKVRHSNIKSQWLLVVCWLILPVHSMWFVSCLCISVFVIGCNCRMGTVLGAFGKCTGLSSSVTSSYSLGSYWASLIGESTSVDSQCPGCPGQVVVTSIDVADAMRDCGISSTSQSHVCKHRFCSIPTNNTLPVDLKFDHHSIVSAHLASGCGVNVKDHSGWIQIELIDLNPTTLGLWLYNGTS